MDLDTLRRTLEQRLESDRRFGLTHLPPAGQPFDLKFLDTVGEPPVAAAPADGPRRSVTAPPAAALRPTALFEVPAGAGIPAGPHVTPPNVERSTQPRPEREAALRVLAERVSGCPRCEELAATRNKTVFGAGNPEAAILFLGEAPGADEDASGVPFVGRAGQLLTDIIHACRLTRDEIYITNILKCRPPGNRNPTPGEAANCREYLTAQLATVDPDYIVCWGRVAAENLLGTKEAVGKLRQRLFPYGRAKVAVTYHPSYLLRNPAAKKDVWADMKWLFRDMGVELQGRRTQ